jgi:hypothetical protein
MKTIAIFLIAGALLMANHSFAQVRLGGGARLAAGASVSTPGISRAVRTTTTSAKSTSQATVDAGKQAEVKTVATADKTVKKADQTASAAAQTNTNVNGQVNANVNGQVKTSTNVHAAAAASAAKQ